MDMALHSYHESHTLPCITGVQDRGSLIQIWYSLLTHRLDLFLLFVQRLVMEQLCGDFTKKKAQLGLFLKTYLTIICFHAFFICNWLISVLCGCLQILCLMMTLGV